MNDWLFQLTEQMKFTFGVSESVIEATEEHLGFSLPKDYAEFMIKSNGASGPIGANSYLVLWPIEELDQINEDYAVNEFAPGLYLFGSDGAGTAYAFDTRSQPLTIVEVPFIGMDLKEVTIIGYTFAEFLKYLH